MDTPDSIFPDQLNRYGADARFLIGFSGGLDSTVLLHLASRHVAPSRLRAVHVHHGLQDDADSWADHCGQICRDLHISLEVIHVKVETGNGESIEAAARGARYAAVEQVLSDAEIFLTGHHLDDQGETLLLQLFRGAGVHGLASMGVERTLGEGRHVRPLLSVSREQIEQYAWEHGLSWIDDPSNDDQRFARNFLRHRIMPELKTFWPGVSRSLSRSARHQARAVALMDEVAQTDLEQLECEGRVLSLSRFTALSENRQLNALRFWLRREGFLAPSEVVLRRVLTEMIPAADDAEPEVVWDDGELRRFAGSLYLMAPIEAADGDWRSPCSETGVLRLPGSLGQLEWQMVDAGFDPGVLRASELHVSFRQGGERCRPEVGGQSRPLKKLLQEWRIPPWERGVIPLVFADNELIAVPGYWLGGLPRLPRGQQGPVPVWNRT